MRQDGLSERSGSHRGRRNGWGLAQVRLKTRFPSRRAPGKFKERKLKICWIFW